MIGLQVSEDLIKISVLEEAMRVEQIFREQDSLAQQHREYLRRQSVIQVRRPPQL